MALGVYAGRSSQLRANSNSAHGNGANSTGVPTMRSASDSVQAAIRATAAFRSAGAAALRSSSAGAGSSRRPQPAAAPASFEPTPEGATDVSSGAGIVHNPLHARQSFVAAAASVLAKRHNDDSSSDSDSSSSSLSSSDYSTSSGGASADVRAASRTPRRASVGGRKIKVQMLPLPSRPDDASQLFHAAASFSRRSLVQGGSAGICKPTAEPELHADPVSIDLHDAAE